MEITTQIIHQVVHRATFSYAREKHSTVCPHDKQRQLGTVADLLRVSHSIACETSAVIRHRHECLLKLHDSCRLQALTLRKSAQSTRKRIEMPEDDALERSMAYRRDMHEVDVCCDVMGMLLGFERLRHFGSLFVNVKDMARVAGLLYVSYCVRVYLDSTEQLQLILRIWDPERLFYAYDLQIIASQ